MIQPRVCPKCGGEMIFKHYTTPVNGDYLSTKLYACLDCKFAIVAEMAENERKGRQTNI